MRVWGVAISKDLEHGRRDYSDDAILQCQPILLEKKSKEPIRIELKKKMSK